MPALHSHPCASRAPCPAVPVPPGVPSDPPCTQISVFPEHPRAPGLRVPMPAVGEPRAVRGQDPPTPFRPVPSRLACSVPALLRSALARHGTARLGSAQVSALPPGTARIGPDRTGQTGRRQPDPVETPDPVSCGGAGSSSESQPREAGGSLIPVPHGFPFPVAIPGAGMVPIPVPRMGHCRAEMPQGDRQHL